MSYHLWNDLVVTLLGDKPKLEEFSSQIFLLIQGKLILQLANKILQESLHFLHCDRFQNYALPFHGHLSILQNNYSSRCILYGLLSLRSRLYHSFTEILVCSWNVVKPLLSHRSLIHGGAKKIMVPLSFWVFWPLRYFCYQLYPLQELLKKQREWLIVLLLH